MLDGDTVKYIDFGLACLTSDASRRTLPAFFNKFTTRCGEDSIAPPGALDGTGDRYNAFGCAVSGAFGGTPAYDAPLKGS